MAVAGHPTFYVPAGGATVPADYFQSMMLMASEDTAAAASNGQQRSRSGEGRRHPLGSEVRNA
jgi:hypothetical protein